MSALRLAVLALGAALPFAAQQTPARPAAPAARQPLTPAQVAAQRAQARLDSARADSLAPRLEYQREVFSYQGGARDPFMTLVTSSDVRPTINDLRLVVVVYDDRGGNHVAVVREAGNPHAHRLRRGDQVGRLRVIQIRRYEVVFQVEEFGFERQEVLSLPRPEANR